ncbi:DNA methyltransferase [Paracoccus sp. SM22M-07]|uniref:class I SAM-dependent DNA methyltransferase n=1 Tax=Paracoccus sp. SM22M-07 TaxID=1520813 RepID=UPI000920BB24|nr:DNA methyltransferase [Paracoccus sp. SM22M-07]OJH43586.1 lactate dehydrogenase [Paracoccus sp. SM22M-07]
MNAVEIEQAISELAEQPFDPAEFPYAFLTAFGNKDTTIKRLRSGGTNKSDFAGPWGGVLQTNNIHLAACAPGAVAEALAALRASPLTARAKAKFILATDGVELEAEDITSGETIACRYVDFPDHFGFFLPLAGISTVKQIRESAFDIRATSRLNRLYVELIKDNPDWGSSDRRDDMNHFMARLIFCFFAEDTDIFATERLFTATVDRMSDRDGANTHEVIGEIFRAMNTPIAKRAEAKLPRWADAFPYVNGGLFSGSTDVPRFSKIAQRYLSHIGGLDWTQINPDIFGSMIQAVADEEERSVLGMHYTSVPNILKVLNPLFLDDLRAELEAAGDNTRKLANLRARMAKIRVFDPACGSGNFLVIAYKEMRAIEAEINRRRGEADRRTDIPLTNYRGIELRSFSAEIARLALIIAEYQCDVTYRGQKEALAEFLPLDAQNWITCGNALRLDWLSVCPPTGTGVKFQADDLFMSPLDQAQIDFENEGGETYICGNPPYKGGTEQDQAQKDDMAWVFNNISKTWKSLDYIAGWFFKFADYSQHTSAGCAFVTTNSICQGEQVARLWPLIFSRGLRISFAHTAFKWSNLASHNAGVTVVIVGLSSGSTGPVRLIQTAPDKRVEERSVQNINAYLVPFKNVEVTTSTKALSDVAPMITGSKPVDGGSLLMTKEERDSLIAAESSCKKYILPYLGANETIKGLLRFCIWVRKNEAEEAAKHKGLSQRFAMVREMREKSKKPLTREGALTPYAFQQIRQKGGEKMIVVPGHSSESRTYLPVSLHPSGILSNSAFGILNSDHYYFAILSSNLHLVWIESICGQLETRIRYSTTLGWNTFPVPKLTDKNRADLTAAAEGILLAREAHFPATIANLYDPEKMPANLRAAHDHNDEVLERIYIGRRFRNDTERLEKLFEMYTKMTTKVSA